MMQVLVRRSPASGLPRFDMGAVHLVDFLETEALRLRNEEPDVEPTEDQHPAKDEENERDRSC